MRYTSGLEVRLGDRIRFSNGDIAIVVLSADTEEYAAEFPKAEWLSIKRGVLVRTEAGALVELDDSLINDIEPL